MSTKSTKKSPEALTPSAEFRQTFGDRYHEHHSVGDYTSTGFGGVADHVVLAQTTEDLMKAGQIAGRHRLPFVVVAGGTGVLISDVGYPGLVIVNRSARIIFDLTHSQAVIDSGVGNNELLNIAASRGLGGVEFLAAVPGSIGGAVATSAGWNNHFIKSAVKELLVFIPDEDEGRVISLTGSEIEAGPMEKIFPSTLEQPPIILTVRLQLAQLTQPEILKRLFGYRRERQKFLEGRQLGYVFTQPVRGTYIRERDLLRLHGASVGLRRGDVDILVRQSDKAVAHSMKQLIGAVKALAKMNGLLLVERVHFLGYWPDEEMNGETNE